MLWDRPGRVYVIGYARYWNTAANATMCELANNGTNFPLPSLGSNGIAAQIDALTVAVNRMFEAAAAATGVIYVDIDTAFDGHRICDIPSAATTVQDSETGYSRLKGYTPFEATKDGNSIIANVFAAAIGLSR